MAQRLARELTCGSAADVWDGSNLRLPVVPSDARARRLCTDHDMSLAESPHLGGSLDQHGAAVHVETTRRLLSERVFLGV